MLLKRTLILAAGVLLFIVTFVIYFETSKFQMEDRFRQEREKYHLDGVVLTSASPAETPVAPAAAPHDTNALIGPVPPASSTPDATAPATAPAPTPDSTSAPVPPAPAPPPPAPAPDGPSSTPAPVPAPAPDTMPSSTPAPVPATDTNAAPTTPAPSTMQYTQNSVFQLASFRPADVVQFPLALKVAQTATAPAATTEPAPAPAVAPSPAPATEEPAAPPPSGEASVIVLLYHQFVPAGVKLSPKLQWTLNEDVFESQMKYIHDNGYHVVPLSDVVKFIKHQITLPPGSVCITIDDGYKSAIVYAAPILKKYGYPWTYYIYPAFITVAESKGAASWNDLLELQQEGIDIESHSMTHPTLTKHGSKTPDEYAAWLKNETAGSKTILEQHMGKPITSFAYPFGAYNKQVEQAVIDAGYETILTVADNPVHSTTPLHSIGRYTITQSVVKNFAAYLHQSALSLTKADPEPGATITDSKPVITAVLDPLGAAKLDPMSLETSVRDFGVVKHDFDPVTNTVRLYLPRPLIQSPVLVNIRIKDTSGKVYVANWHFNFEPGNGAPTHAPITTPATPATTTTTAPEPLEKAAAGTPLDAHPNKTD